MWMKRYGWDAICRNGDADGPGGAAEGLADVEAQVDAATPSQGSSSTSSNAGRGDVAAAATAMADVEHDVDIETDTQGSATRDPGRNTGNAFLDNLDRSIQVNLGKNSKGPPAGTSIGSMFSAAQAIGQGLNNAAVSLGLDPQAPAQGPSTSDETGATDFGGDGAEQAAPAANRLARSVRSASRNDASGSGASRTPAPAPALNLPSSDIDEIRAELDAEREARRRRRRTTRQSTIVTGPLGVPGRPELLQPTAIAGASRRLLGQ